MLAEEGLALAALLDAMLDTHDEAVAAAEERLQAAAAFLSLGALDVDSGSTRTTGSSNTSTAAAQVAPPPPLPHSQFTDPRSGSSVRRRVFSARPTPVATPPPA